MGNTKSDPANAIPIWNGGYDYLNIAANGYTQIKSGRGTFGGLGVNTVGTTSNFAAYDGLSSIVTISIATPGVISWAGHGLVAGDAVKFTSTGALPTGLVIGTTYYVSTAGLTGDTFRVADTRAHALAGTNTVNTSGSQSGVQRGWDVTRPIGTYSTVAVASLPVGAMTTKGLIGIAAGAGAADLTVLYR